MSIHPINSVDIPEYKRQFALRGVICDPCEDGIPYHGAPDTVDLLRRLMQPPAGSP